MRAIGRAPHPTGSPANDEVRHHIARRLAGLGLAPEVHAGQAAATPGWAPARLAAATVQNLVAVLPGHDRAAPAVLVAAHYDSVANSPGAADDGAGVAASLEIARALAADARAGRPPARDVIFLFTDGEELGLLGAEAFFAGDPLARHVGVMVNMEARGDAGRAAMYQSGPHAGPLLALYGRAADHPYAASFTAFLSSLLPNDTDFSVALRRRAPGLNFAFIGDQLAYHTPLSTPGHLDPASLQSLGGQALPAVRALAEAPRLPAPGPDLAYADLPLLGWAAYPAQAGGWALAALATALIAWAGWRARRLGLASYASALRGGACALFAVSASALALHTAGRLLGGADSPFALYRLLGAMTWVEAGAGLLAAGVAAGVYALAAQRRGRRARSAVAGLALAVGLLASLRGLDLVGIGLGLVTAALALAALRRGTDAWSGWLGALAVGALATLALQLAAPPLAPLVLWPLLPAALGAALVFGAGAHEAAGRLALLAAALLAVASAALALGWTGALVEALGPALPAAAALGVLLGLPALAPFARLAAAGRSGAAVVILVAASGAALLAAAGLHRGSPARPELTTAYAVAEAPAPGAPPARAWRVANALDGWTRGVLEPGRPELRILPALGPWRVWTVPLAPWPEPAPFVSATAMAGRLVVTVRPTGPTRELRIDLRGAGLGDPRLNAHPVDWRAGRGGARTLRYAAPPPEGVTLSFSAPPHGRAEVQVAGLADGWPPGAKVPPKPADLMGWYDSDTRRVSTRLPVSW